MSKLNRSSSSIITSFIEAKQQLEVKNTTHIDSAILQRRTEFLSNSPNKRRESTNSKRDLKNQIKNAERYRSMDEHKIPLDELYRRLETSEKGITDQKAFELNKKYGDNVLSMKKKTPWYILLLKEMVGSFSLLLWLGAVLCFISYGIAPQDPSNFYLAIALSLVNIFTGCQTFYQNSKSESIMESFKNFIPPQCKAIRGDHIANLMASKLVPGDIVEVRSGERIPADIRIIYSQEMKVDNSSLTGESDPLLRTVKCTNESNPLETGNLAFFGTLCKEGIARGVVINIGDHTIIGQIASLASSAGHLESTLSREMTRFVKIIASIAIGTGIFFFGMGFVLGYPAVTNISFGVGVLCSYVPEGLVTCVVIGLSLTAVRLSKKKVLVKNLSSVETLGSTTCICSDKTGTLTQNKMTVENVWYDGKIFKGTNYEKLKASSKEPEYKIECTSFQELQLNVILSSDACFNNSVPSDKLEELKKLTNPAEIDKKRTEIEKKHQEYLRTLPWTERPVIGDASESALVRFFQPIEDIEVTRLRYPIKKMKDGSQGRIPFNSQWKYALSIVDYKIKDSENCILIKGAPERIWSLCSHILIEGKEVPIDSKWKKSFHDVNLTFGNNGERVLGFAKRHLDSSEYPKSFQFDCNNPMEPNYPMDNFIFTGLISMIDPPRDTVPFAILKCKTAGIKVIMVTGDQPVTATAIARQVNIFQRQEKTVNQIAEEKGIPLMEAFDEAEAIVIHGDMINEAAKKDELLPESERGRMMLKWLEKPRVVFARTTPAQKLIIVKACQTQGHIVAVTGDGVNDSPAIKKADIGIAMGITGSDVAKDAASMILLSDDFAAIVLGVEEGRKIFDNIKRAIVYILSEDITELVPFLTLIIVGFPLPLSTILILCVDLGFNFIPSISWSSEEAEIDIMVRPPRRKHEYLANNKVITTSFGIYGVIQSYGTFLVYVIVMRDFGIPHQSLQGLGVANGIYPNPGDTYDPSAPYHGHTSQKFIDYCTACWAGTQDCDPNNLDSSSVVDPAPDWLFSLDMEVDLRLHFLMCTPDGGITNRVDWGPCYVKQLSTVTGQPVCYTTETLKNAQTAVYAAIMISQMHSSFIVKTRSQSFIYSGLKNYQLMFGWSWMVMFCMMIAYFKPLNVAFNSRSIVFLHFGWACFPFLIVLICYDELRKFLMRTIPARKSVPNWFVRNTYW